jgi:hypothetical protein
MKIIISFLLLVMVNPFKSQSFYDVVEIGGYQYMISPSPSLYYFDSDQYDHYFKANYYIQDSKLFMDEMTGVNRRIKSKEFKDSIWDMEPYGEALLLDGEYTLVRLAEDYRTKEIFKKTGIHLDEYNSKKINISVNEGEVIFPFMFDFENSIIGELSVSFDYYEVADFNIFNEDGKLMYQYNDFDTDLYNQSFYLPEGEYKVEIKYDDYNKTYEKISIYGETTTFLNAVDPYYEVDEDNCFDCSGFSFDNFNSSISLLYGNNQILQNEESEINSFGLRIQQGEELFVGNNSIFSIIPFGAGAYSLNVGHADSSLINGTRVKHQYYSYFVASAGVAARLYLNRYKNSNDARPYLEIGSYYNLPIVFRQISRVDNYKRSERWISRYNDVQVYGKLGITNRIGLQGSYRLFDVVKNNYPQLPKLQVGLTVDINY